MRNHHPNPDRVQNLSGFAAFAAMVRTYCRDAQTAGVSAAPKAALVVPFSLAGMGCVSPQMQRSSTRGYRYGRSECRDAARRVSTAVAPQAPPPFCVSVQSLTEHPTAFAKFNSASKKMNRKNIYFCC
jgi:hypothetical protein